jgi:hypothetical protein
MAVLVHELPGVAVQGPICHDDFEKYMFAVARAAIIIYPKPFPFLLEPLGHIPLAVPSIAQNVLWPITFYATLSVLETDFFKKTAIVPVPYLSVEGILGRDYHVSVHKVLGLYRSYGQQKE